MTFEEKIISMLIENGMWQSQTEKVLKIFKKSQESAFMIGIWDHEINDYPKEMLGVIWMGVKPTALKWIDENKPEAFYRDMFK